MSESWFEGVGLAESPFAAAESAVTDEVGALAGAWPAEAVRLPPSWPEDEEYEQPASGEDPPGLQRMLQLPGRFDDPKRDPAIDKDGTRFDLFLGGRSRRDFASSWLAQRPGLAEAAREPMADLTAGDIAKAWFVIHDVGVKSSLGDRRFKAADKATKKGSVHGFLNRGGYYAATHDFSKDRKGTVYEFLSRKGKKIAGGTTINIETVPDIENGVADRADGSHGPPSNADRYASIGYRKAAAKKVNYYKWTNAAFDILADLYILASARAGHLLTITAHKEMDRNLGRSVIWREYSAAEIRQAANKFLKKARDNPSDYHGDPFAFDVQALYDVITRKLNALGGVQMPPGARYGVHPLRLRTASGADVGNGDGQLHEFPHQSDPRVKTDTKLKKPGWWAKGSRSEAEGFADESFDEALWVGEDEVDGFGEDPGAAFEDPHAFEGEETETGLGGEAMAEAERPKPEAATPWNEGAFGEYLDENGLTPGPISSYSESIGDFAREAGYEAVAQARACLGGSIWTYASRACGSRVSVFVPAAAQGREKVDLMLYVHGLLGPCGAPRVMPEGLVSAAPFALGKIVAESARPMILVVPRFQPGNDKSWSPHLLDRPGAINALFAEVLTETGRRLNRAAPAIDQLIVAGHSRAFGILYPLARASASPELGKGALARLSRIWALDATYGKPPIAAFESLTKAKQGLRVEIVYRARSATDKFNGASRAGALALRPIPLSITHCAVPGCMLPALLAELPPPRPKALDAGSEAEDLWAETPGSGWSQSEVTETEWLEAEADALDRFDTSDSQTWDESHAFGESRALDEVSLESEDESPAGFQMEGFDHEMSLAEAENARYSGELGAIPGHEALSAAFEAEDLFEAEEFARHALYEAIVDEDADLGEDVGDHELEVVPARSRPPIRRTAQLRTAWRDYECAQHKMRTLRLFGWDTPVNPNTVDAWRALEQALLTAGYQAHRAWVFKCRDIGGQQTRSLHAYGLAIDIDHARPTCNVNRATPDGRAVIFSTAATKDERCRDVRQGRADTSFTPAQVAAVEALRTVDGHQVFAWGGRWRTTKDTMHFQINVTPAELARGIRLEPESGAAKSDLFEDEMDAVESFVPPVAMPPFTREHYQMSDREVVVVRARHGGRQVRRRVTDIVAEVLRLAGQDTVAWYNDFTSGVTFLGRPIRDPIHVHLAEHLHDAERRLAARYGGANADPTAAGVALGLDKKDKIIGSRPYPTSAAVSMHMFGLAIDVNYTANPYISEKADPVFARAGQLIRHRPAAWRTRMTYAQLSDLNQTLKGYFALLGDDAALQASLTDATTEPWHGKTVAQAQSRIQKDLQYLARLWERTDRDQLAVLRKTGFMNLKQEFVEGIGLSWGAAYGDMMHFDMRNDGGIGQRIYAAIRRWIAQQQAKAAAPPAP